MKRYIKTLIDRKHMVRDGTGWRRVGYSESIMSQFDRWRLDSETSKRSVKIVNFKLHDFVAGIEDMKATECFPCHVAIIQYIMLDEAAKYGVVDKVVEALPHHAMLYDKIRKNFFNVQRTGRVLCPKVSPLLTFFAMDADIDALGPDVDCCDLPLPANIYDYVVYDNVLFDCTNPHEAILSAKRVLQRGGHLIITEQLFGPVTGRTWWRLTPSMLRKMLEGFREIYLNTWGGPRALMHTVMSNGGWDPMHPDTLKEVLNEHDPRWPLYVWAIAVR